MANMEKITEYRITHPKGHKVLFEYFFNNDTGVVEVLANGVMDSNMAGTAWIEMLSNKAREKFNKPQAALFDFLNARLGD